MKVLIVDDSRSDRKIIRFNFEWHGCQVFEAANGRQGLELAAAKKPDLIISDSLMPVMDGFRFLQKLKSREDLKSIPVIFYAAVYAGGREVEIALGLGARAFLEKPQHPEELWEEVGRLMAAGEGGEAATRTCTRPESEFLGNYSQLVTGKLERRVWELAEEKGNLARLNGELERRVLERTAQLEAANRELELFSYSISHDLRAPLRHIDGFSQALQEEYAAELAAGGREYLGRIVKSSRRMLEMIDAILELSRYARSKPVRENLDLSAMAREVGGALAGSHCGRVVELRVAGGLTARGDTQLVRVALEKLLGNAWKFTAKTGEPLVEFYGTTWGGRTAFAVRDNGAGFDSAYADKLFAPFQRVHSQEEFPGCGMGLAIVKRIITLHGGEIRAEAAPGRGATFVFTV